MLVPTYNLGRIVLEIFPAPPFNVGDTNAINAHEFLPQHWKEGRGGIFSNIWDHGHQHGGRKPAEKSVTEFCYKRVNLSLEELKNVTIILNSKTRTVQIAEFREISHLLNQHHSSLARHANATSRKSIEIQA